MSESRDLWEIVKRGNAVKPWDIALVAAFLAAAALFAFSAFAGERAQGADAEIYVDGSPQKSLRLDVDEIVPIFGARGTEIIAWVSVADGEIAVAEAVCPDRLCVKTGGISKANQTIVCLPNRMVIEIKSPDSSGLDAVTR